MLENSLYDKFDISEVRNIQKHFSEFINNSVVRFEFVTIVLSDFNSFRPREKSKKTVEFIEKNWKNYVNEFSVETLEPNRQEILVKEILARIIYQYNTINRMKEKNLI